MIKILVLSLAVAAVSAALPTAFYYEAHCPDSINFFTNQFGPAYATIGADLDVTFVPFGKAQKNPEADGFVCQHGPAECYYNKIQSCVLHELSTQAEQAAFVVCAMAPGFPSIEDCVADAGLSWTTIDDCAEGELGFELQVAAMEATQIISPAFVPTIVYNEVFDQTLQDSSLTDFAGTVAEILNA